MRVKSSLKISFIFLFMLCFLLFSIMSCSDAAIGISNIYPQLVYEYASKNSTPDVKLSVFAEVTSGSNRMQSMTVKNTSNNMVWTVEPVDVVTDFSAKKTYAGYSALCMPGTLSFEKAVYQVVYVDMAGKKTDALFSLNPADAESYGKTALNSSNKQYLVVSTAGKVLYSGSYKDDFSSADGVKKAYPEALYYREYVLNTELNSIYLMPAVYIKSE